MIWTSAGLVTNRPTFQALVILISTGFLYFFYRLYRRRRWFDGLPQPPHHFLWGHLKVLGEVSAMLPPNTHPQILYTAIAQKYNLEGIFYLDLWPVVPSAVVLTNPGLSDHVTVVQPLRQHSAVGQFLAPIVGPNVIAAANGAIWKKLHNAMAPTFAWTHVRSLTGVIIEEGKHFRDTLDRLVRDREVVSMEDIATKLVFDIITRVVFNFSLDAQTKGSTTLDDLVEMSHLVTARFSFNPWVHFVSFFRRHSVLRRIHPIIKQKIKERLDLINSGNAALSKRDPESLLDLMLHDYIGDKPQKRTETNIVSLEYNELLLTNIKGLLIGGHGSTANTLCWIYMLLSKAPEVVKKLREEHTRVFDEDFDQTINMLVESPAKLEELEYTAAVIKETLRLFPIGFGTREADPGMTLHYDGQMYPIDNQLAVSLNGHTVHYDPKLFPDPGVFRPDRWVEEQVPRPNFRAFGRGARSCIGVNLAQNILRSVMLMTIRHYDFECVDLKPNAKPRASYTQLDTVFGDIVFQELAFEAKPRGGMMMKLKSPVEMLEAWDIRKIGHGE